MSDLDEQIHAVVEAFSTQTLPVNTTGWVKLELLSCVSEFRTGNFLREPDKFGSMLKYAPGLMERIQWLRQHIPVHKLEYRYQVNLPELNGRGTRLIFNVFLPKQKHLLHYRMRWDNLVDTKWSK